MSVLDCEFRISLACIRIYSVCCFDKRMVNQIQTNSYVFLCRLIVSDC